MKLYFSPGACSQAVHIALREADFKFELEKVDLGAKKTASGGDFRQINPLGYVPVLELGNGERLTEASALLLYIADKANEQHLAPPHASFAYFKLVSTLVFVATELHKGLGALFNPSLPDAVKKGMIDRVFTRFDFVEGKLARQPYVCGEDFTVADIYLFVISGWAAHFQIDLSRWPQLSAWRAKIGERPAVRAALSAEGF